MTNCQQEEHADSGETLSILEAMRRQESTSYKCEDYIARSVLPGSSVEDMQTLETNRSKMTQWCMTLVNACGLNSNTVSIAMSNLDRFLATDDGLELLGDSETFQLACMASLYSAIKVHEERAFSPQTLSNISRGFYSARDMETMEFRILQALQWRVNAPTPMSFVNEFLKLIPDYVLNSHYKEHVLSLVRIQTELSVAAYNFVTIKPSSIGFAALINAMDILSIKFDIVQSYILDVKGITIDTDEVLSIQNALYTAVAATQETIVIQQQQSNVNTKPLTPSTSKHDKSFTISPRTVCGQAAQAA